VHRIYFIKKFEVGIKSKSAVFNFLNIRQFIKYIVINKIFLYLFLSNLYLNTLIINTNNTNKTNTTNNKHC